MTTLYYVKVIVENIRIRELSQIWMNSKKSERNPKKAKDKLRFAQYFEKNQERIFRSRRRAKKKI